MAPKDYVKRPQAKKQPKRRNTRNTRSASNVHKGSASWMKIIIALLVIAIFVFGLYRLSSVDKGENNANTNKQTNSDTALNSAKTDARELETVINNESQVFEKLPDLPVLGEEEWEYIDALPDYSVEVDATGPLERGKDFIMQCGSFRTMDRAEALRAKIAFQGLESRILSSEGKNGTWYRVVLGPFARKRLAEKYRHQLRDADINGCKIW